VSQAKGEYFKSFKIIGDLANACRVFDERYDPPTIFDNWEPNDETEGLSDWTFVSNPGSMMKNKLSFR